NPPYKRLLSSNQIVNAKRLLLDTIKQVDGEEPSVGKSSLTAASQSQENFQRQAPN
uniref:Uncharacterized protein n=1 Tax=Amphimedon queenslandica TaxID=400682 RepID=A0A1X7U6A9_AMPQE